MKILVVCQHYYPESFKVNDLCEQLVKDGNEVTALVGLPNYPKGYVLDEYKHNKNRDEHINGVHVIRCFEIGRRKGPIFLALNYLSFWFSSLNKVNSLDKDFDVVLGFESSPVMMADAGRKYAKLNNKPFIIWCYDIWPECLKVYIKSESNIIFKIFKKVSKKIYSSANLVLCTSNTFIDYFKRVHNLTNTKYLPQYGDDSYLDKDFNSPESKTINFVFTGNIGKPQQLEKALDAFKKIEDLDYKFHIVGDGSDLDNLKDYAKSLDLNDKVIFYGQKPYKELDNYYRLADACIVSLESNTEIGLTLPAKVQNYMAIGKPIVGMISGSAKQVIEESNCGLCAEGNDTKGFANILKEFILNKDKYNNCGINARNYYRKNFTKKSIINKLEEELLCNSN